MAQWNTEQAVQELLAVLPLLNRIVGIEVRKESGQDTTIPQFRVLGHLVAQPITLSDLARQRRVTLQSMGELVQALVKRGWVLREPDPHDRRQQLLSLTPEGQLHYERTQREIMAHLLPLIAQLSAEEMQAIQVALPALWRVLAGDMKEKNDGEL